MQKLIKTLFYIYIYKGEKHEFVNSTMKFDGKNLLKIESDKGWRKIENKEMKIKIERPTSLASK